MEQTKDRDPTGISAMLTEHRQQAREGELTALLNTPVEADPQVVTSADGRWEATAYTIDTGTRKICTLYLQDKDPSWIRKFMPTTNSDDKEVFDIPRGNKYHFGAIGFSYTKKHVTASVFYVAQGDEERLHGTAHVRLRR